jgi:arylsulfatase A-like enzyme
MEELIAWGKTYGWWLPVLYVLVKYGNVAWKKRTGRYVSYSALEKRIEKVASDLEFHLKDHRITDRDFAVLQNSHNNLSTLFRDTLVRMDKNIDNIWKALDDLRSRPHG